MDAPQDLSDTLQRLEARIHALESLYGLIDLLALPGLLAGGAARIFDSIQTAETIAAQAPGFYGREADGRGFAIRWTRFPDPGRLDIAVLASIPFRVEVRALHMPHVNAPDDVVLLMPEGERVAFDTVEHPAEGVIEFGGLVMRPNTGLVSLSVSTRAALPNSGADARQLGLPFVHLRARPIMSFTATE